MRVFSAKSVPAPPQQQLRFSDFDLSYPVDIEIGAGVGMHAVNYAIQNPNRQIIALERTLRALKMLALKKSQPDLTNLHILRTDAVNWITHFVPPQAIDRIFLLYPNPYPKNRQKNLRWHNMPFMGFLKSRLKPTGLLILATNSEDFCVQAEMTMVNEWGFRLAEKTQLNLETTKPRTHFERKYLLRGEPCWNLVFELPQSDS